MKFGTSTPKQLNLIAEGLVSAQDPLAITGYSGRNTTVVLSIVDLANIAKRLRVLDTMCSDLCYPADHPGQLGVMYGSDEAIRTADMMFGLDCNATWTSTQCKPANSAKIFHFDIDHSKNQMPVFYIDAILRCRVNTNELDSSNPCKILYNNLT